MGRIHSILSSSFFKNEKNRDFLIQFVEKKLNVSITAFRNYQPYFELATFNLKEEVIEAINHSKMYINFEHDASDKTLQKMIFLFLFYSVEKFPNMESWTAFYNEREEVKIEIIKKGIVTTWSYFQISIMSDLLEVENYEF